MKNASPATVSRAGIIFVSETDLDWSPVTEGIIRARPKEHQACLRAVVAKYMGVSNPSFPGELFNFINRNTKPVQTADRVGCVCSLFDLMTGLLDGPDAPVKLSGAQEELEGELERVFLYCLTWSCGGLLDTEDRAKFDAFLRGIDDNGRMPGQVFQVVQ